MEANWYIIGVVVAAAIALVVYIIRENLKDKEELTHKLNNEYKSRIDADSESEEFN